MQTYANLVELEKCGQTHIFLQILVLIQPRTSPPKICKILQLFFAKFANLLILLTLPLCHRRNSDVMVEEEVAGRRATGVGYADLRELPSVGVDAPSVHFAWQTKRANPRL